MAKSLGVDSSTLEDIAESFGATSREVDAMIRRAIVQTMASLQRVVVKDAARKAAIKNKIIEMRAYRSKPKKGKLASTLSIISYDVPAVVLNPQQNRRGVETSKRMFDSAFLARAKYGKFEKRVFRRTGLERGPLKEVKVHVEQPLEQEVEWASGVARETFIKHFYAQLNLFVGKVAE